MAYGAPWSQVCDPGMPLTSSLVLSRPKRRPNRSPRSPHQLARMPVCIVGLREERRRPLDGVDLGDERGVDERGRARTARRRPSLRVAPARRSQMALCSRMNSVWNMASPSHQFSLNPVSATNPVWVSSGNVTVLSEQAVLVRANRRVLARIASVDRGAVPPVRLGVDVGRREVLVVIVAGGVPLGLRDPHGGSRTKGRRRGSGISMCASSSRAVGKPVVGLELDPGGGEEVERCGRREGLAPS